MTHSALAFSACFAGYPQTPCFDGDDPKLASLKQGIVFFPSMLRRFGSIDSTSKGVALRG